MLIRVVTYNIHACVGTDGQLSVERVAQVLKELSPDVACLQEVDMGRRRSGSAKQAELISELLEMEHIFRPSFELDGGAYGNAILSRLPLTLDVGDTLPYKPSAEIKVFRKIICKGSAEVRSALRVSLPGGISIVNTHLTVDRRERMHQVEALMSDRWLGQEPLILCGDFNTTPKSPHYKLIRDRLKDAQQSHKATFHSRVTVSPIDHIFVSDHWKVLGVEVVKNELTKKASDHLPLVADLELESYSAK